MLKIDRKFVSFYNYLTLLENETFNPVGQNKISINTFFKDQVFGALQPLNEILHDIQYTFKGYTSTYEFLIDVIQPLRGLKNILLGIINIVSLPFFLLVKACTYSLENDDCDNYKDYMTGNLLLSLSWLIHGINLVIRGGTQILATLLTLAIRMPLRESIMRHFGTPTIYDNEEIIYLVDLAEEALEKNAEDELVFALENLHKEYQICVDEYYEIGELTENVEEKCFNELQANIVIKKEPIQKYLGLFAKPEAKSTDIEALYPEANTHTAVLA